MLAKLLWVFFVSQHFDIRKTHSHSDIRETHSHLIQFSSICFMTFHLSLENFNFWRFSISFNRCLFIHFRWNFSFYQTLRKVIFFVWAQHEKSSLLLLLKWVIPFLFQSNFSKYFSSHECSDSQSLPVECVIKISLACKDCQVFARDHLKCIFLS